MYIYIYTHICIYITLKIFEKPRVFFNLLFFVFQMTFSIPIDLWSNPAAINLSFGHKAPLQGIPIDFNYHVCREGRRLPLQRCQI